MLHTGSSRKASLIVSVTLSTSSAIATLDDTEKQCDSGQHRAPPSGGLLQRSGDQEDVHNPLLSGRYPDRPPSRPKSRSLCGSYGPPFCARVD